jgi:hypothetical protein
MSKRVFHDELDSMINGAPSDGKAAQNLTQTLFSGE